MMSVRCLWEQMSCHRVLLCDVIESTLICQVACGTVRRVYGCGGHILDRRCDARCNPV